MNVSVTAPLVPLNHGSPVPLYHQLARSLTHAIQQGVYLPGQRLPSEPALAKRYGVTRPTVRQATRLLSEQRLVEARRGAGTFVRERSQEVDLFSLAGTLESFQKSGLGVQRRLLEKVRLARVPDDLRANPFAGRVVFQFKRLSRVRKRPLLLEEFFVDPKVFPELTLYNLSVKSFARVVQEHYFLSPQRGKQTFRVKLLDEARARALALKRGQPALMVCRTLDFSGAPAAVYSELFCRTEEFSFCQTLEANP